MLNPSIMAVKEGDRLCFPGSSGNGTHIESATLKNIERHWSMLNSCLRITKAMMRCAVDEVESGWTMIGNIPNSFKVGKDASIR